jgi:hypothetical protein
MDAEKKMVSEFAIASLVIGILSFINLFNLEKSLVAIIFGLLALKRIKGDIQLGGKKRAIAGIVLGVLSVTLSIMFVIKFLPQMRQLQQQMMQQK